MGSAQTRAGCDAFHLFHRWLVYSKPFFDDDPYVLEPGGYPNLKAWGAKDPSICSMHPIRLVSAASWCVVPGCWGCIQMWVSSGIREIKVWKQAKRGFGKCSCGIGVRESFKRAS